MEREVHEKVSKSLEHKLKIIKLWPLRIGISSVVRGIVSLLYCLQEPEMELYHYGFLTSGIFPEGPKSENELVSIWLDKTK